MRTLILLLSVILLMCYILVLQADTIHVPDDQPTIQAGIDATVDGDTVIVVDGTYTDEGNRDIDFLGKAIVVMSENGPEMTIINCEGDSIDPHRGFYLCQNEDSSSVIQGFTIINGWASNGGGIYCEESSPMIIGNVISENYSEYVGGGIRCDYSNAIIKRNLISNNEAYSNGGGCCFASSNPTFINNTVSQNIATRGGGLYCWGSLPTITNCIFWADSAIYNQEFYSVVNEITATYSNIQGGWEGEGNINDDPLFVDPESGDFHLLFNSPCIDTGDPDSPPDPDSTRVDMGAYYFPQDFPPGILSVTVVPDTTYYHKGDTLGFICNVTNNTDTTVFFQGWTEAETPGGIILSPQLGPINVLLGAQQTVSPHIGQRIPWITPYGGPYIYRVEAGEFPDSVLAEDSFEFFIVP